MVWLGVVAKPFYSRNLGFLMRSDVNWGAAILFYLLFITGLVLFVIAPAVEKGSWVRALGYGALFGLITYATYDLTNLATLKHWPVLVTVVDLGWGMVLAGAVSTANATLAAGGKKGIGPSSGGDGSAGATILGTGGAFTAGNAAGAGGGGAGRIRINTKSDTATLSGTISPATSTACATQGTVH
jgi:uncharacterized membrane protein